MNRIRFAMAPNANPEKMTGTVEVDETYVGGKQRGVGRGNRDNTQPVVALVQRGGRVHSFPVDRVTINSIVPLLKEHIAGTAQLNTDDSPIYRNIKPWFPHHATVNHTEREYVRRESTRIISTNTVEGYFSLVKRGINGIYHNVSHEYLERYPWQFGSLYNNRQLNDGERTALAIKSAEGKRMVYRTSESSAEVN
jgi:transposase-like protein